MRYKRYVRYAATAMRVVLIAAALVAAGCATARTRKEAGATIAVYEFAVAPETIVERYSGPPQELGMRFAEILADQLSRRGYEATTVPHGSRSQADLQVAGRIAEIDGGDTVMRAFLGWAGLSEFDVCGKVTRLDGTLVGEFTESRTGDGISNAMLRAAKLIGGMIHTSKYGRNAPAGRPGATACTTLPSS